ncbi:hypothetical protein GQ43DRAFT_445169 [Delitschia confertaspora ATCC 74209]|uniref:Pathway-specific nitrogen regulator n=1 Tax=Delitschia confertaspora ATCC 74209 TaxID=1513339 RepID=A0A9P4JDN2_9PLEO|nr:hypothetical protein GQ43DRAFT_445169 [Delitschia confertaspora ATCC 74209]
MTTIETFLPQDDHLYTCNENPEHRPEADTTDDDQSFISDMSLPEADEPMASIEQEHDHEEEESGGEPEPYNSTYTSRPSTFSSRALRRASGVTTTSLISSLPSELSVAFKPVLALTDDADARYTPRKERPPFRNPSSVRAMQMASPPPFTSFERDRLKGQYKLGTPSRSGRSETSGSVSRSQRQGSHRLGSHHGSHRESLALVQQSPRPAPASQQHYPLVLLHVTILPLQMPYDAEMMTKIAPEWLMENYRLLEEKLKDVVLIQRGLLIPHPKDEYELLKCGHFVGTEYSDEEDSDDDVRSVTDDGTGRQSRMSGGTVTGENVREEDGSFCHDCHRHLKKPGKGVGLGNKRWDIKIFAANGLMRAGAWAAAWSEMERVDVEILPWIPEEVRKALEKRNEEEEQKQVVQQQKAVEDAELKRKISMEIKRKVEEDRKRLKELDNETNEKKRLEEILAQKIEEAKEDLRIEIQAQSQVEFEAATEKLRQLEDELRKAQAKPLAELSPSPPPKLARAASGRCSNRTQSRGRSRPSSIPRTGRKNEIPLSTLLKNYILLLAKDPRNIALAVLSAFVAFLAMRVSRPSSGQLPVPSRSRILAEPHLVAPDSPFIVTMTATATETAVLTATTTMTQVQRVTRTATHTATIKETVRERPSSVRVASMASIRSSSASHKPQNSAAVDPVEEQPSVSVVAESVPKSFPVAVVVSSVSPASEVPVSSPSAPESSPSPIAEDATAQELSSTSVAIEEATTSSQDIPSLAASSTSEDSVVSVSTPEPPESRVGANAVLEEPSSETTVTEDIQEPAEEDPTPSAVFPIPGASIESSPSPEQSKTSAALNDAPEGPSEFTVSDEVPELPQKAPTSSVASPLVPELSIISDLPTPPSEETPASKLEHPDSVLQTSQLPSPPPSPPQSSPESVFSYPVS